MLKLLMSLLIVTLRIPGLMWQGTAYFVQNNLKTTSDYPTWRHSTNNKRVAIPDAGDPFFGPRLDPWRDKILHVFHFLQPDIVLRIVTPFS